MEKEPTKNNDLKSQILTKIESEAVVPRSRLFFNGCQLGLWLLWLLTALIGAAAIAVTLFIFSYQNFAMYEITHPNFFDFVMDIVPLLWFLVIISTLALAVFNVRHTKSGYRYPLWQIISSSLLLSVIGGLSLHVFGMGFTLDKKLGLITSHYESQERFEQKMWQQPEKGRLVGHLTEGEAVLPVPYIIFTDIKDNQWQMNIDDLNIDDINNLNSQKKVRILGIDNSGAVLSFHACAVFPWVYDYEHTIKELGEMRDQIRQQVMKHKLGLSRSDEGEEESEILETACGKLESLRRMQAAN
jgi:hypothetical protein